MNDKGQHIDQLFRDALVDREHDVPVFVWDNINSQLDADKKRRFVIFMRSLAAAAAILLSFSLGYFVSHNKNVGPDKVMAMQNLIPTDTVGLSVMYASVDGFARKSPVVSAQATAQPKDQLAEVVVANVPQVSGISGERHAGNGREGNWGPISGVPVVFEEHAAVVSACSQVVVSTSTVRGFTSGQSVEGAEAVAYEGVVEQPVISVYEQVAKNDMIAEQALGTGKALLADTLIASSHEVFALVDTVIAEDRKKEIAVHVAYNLVGPDLMELPELLYNDDLSVDLLANVTKETEQEESKWAIGGSFTPLLDYSNFKEKWTNKEIPIVNSDKSFTMTEQTVESYSVGLSFEYKATKRLKIQSGFYVSRMEQMVDGIVAYEDGRSNETRYLVGLVSKQQAIDMTDYVEKVRGVSGRASLQPVSLRQSDIPMSQEFGYVEVPVSAVYCILDKRLGISINCGVAASFLTGQKATMQGADVTGELEAASSSLFRSTLGLGFEYDITNKLSLSVNPTFRYLLQNDLYVQPYSVGFFSGINYSF